MSLDDRVGAENDGWRVANVTLRFERGTAFAQHIITMRSQLLRLASLAMSRRSFRGPERNELSGRAKDLGSAAVFLCQVLIGLTWATLAWRNFFT